MPAAKKTTTARKSVLREPSRTPSVAPAATMPSVMQQAWGATTSVASAPFRSTSPYSLSGLLQFFSDNAGLVLIGLSIFIVGFLSGSMYTENMLLKKGGFVAAGTTPTASTQPTAQQPAPVTVTKEQIQGLFKQGMITFGKKDAKVVFVEFSDPSCPYCHIAAGKNGELNKQAGDRFKLVADGGTYVAPVEEMKKLVDQGKAAFVWAYSNGHGNGELGTKALYCAHEKGRFWQVHDKLMSKEGYDLINNTVKNDKAQSGTLAEFLKDAVDQNFLKSCLESGKYDGKIAEDQSLASSLGVNGTPGFFVNTTNYAGAYSYKDMEATVTAALK